MPQGANPFSDTLCRESLRQAGKYLVGQVNDRADHEARHAMMYAATLAGVGFGNAGCHLPHAMSYPVSGRVENYQPEGYPVVEPICPHGMSVIVNAPAAIPLYGSRDVQNGMPKAQELLGADAHDTVPAEAGAVLAGHIEEMMQATGVPNGIGGVGFTEEAVDGLAQRGKRSAETLAGSACFSRRSGFKEPVPGCAELLCTREGSVHHESIEVAPVSVRMILPSLMRCTARTASVLPSSKSTTWCSTTISLFS